MNSFPPEVLAHIIGYIGGDDKNQTLKNARSTCWAFANGAAPFLFDQARVWLERDSLQRLVYLSEHQVYSQCIRQITFGVDRLNPYVYYKEQYPHLDLRSPWPRRNARDIEALYERASESITEDYGGSYPVEHEILRARRLVEHIEFQKRMERENLDISILSSAMRRLPRLTDIVFDSAYTSVNCTQLARDGLDIFGLAPAWHCHVLQVGLQALSQAGRNPRRLSVTNSSDFMTKRYIPAWAFNEVDVLIPQPHLCSVVEGLRVFQFDGFVPYPREVKKGTLGRFLENALNLEEIHLSLPGSFLHEPIEDFLGRKPFRRLRKLLLSELVVVQENLTPWLLLHSRSLRSIILQDTSLAEGGWDEFLDSIRTRHWLSLSSIELIENLSYEHHEQGSMRQNWNWKYGPAPLVNYVQGKTEVNPYHQFHPGWFPELFEPT